MDNLNTNTVRYIIPFYFEIKKNTHFNSLCRKLKNVGGSVKEPLWVEYKIDDSECDLYEPIQKSMQSNLYENQGIGQSYRINSNCRQKYLKKLKVINEDSTFVEVSFCDMGLHIFRVGIGFFWYELKIVTSDMDELLSINNMLKEISHHNTKKTLLEVKSINQKLSVPIEARIQDLSKCDNSSSYIKICGKRNEYIDSSEIDIDIQNKKDIYFYLRDNEIWYKYSEELEFEFLTFIEEHLSIFPDIKYFAGRYKIENGEQKYVPDKAILFSAVNTINFERKELLEKLYWLGKGYVSSYCVSESYLDDYKNAVFEPFQGVLWYASMEGCAQIIAKSENRERNIFFTTTYFKRLENYFYVYVLILYQYYGLLKFDEGISNLPNDILGYDNINHRKSLHSYKQQLSFFMMNSVFLCVSHITHQNQFFDYLKGVYETDKLTNLMQNKVEIMNELVEQWQEKLKARNILAFSIIGGIFIVIQTLNNVLGMYNYFAFSNQISIGLYSAITMLFSVLMGVLIWLFVRNKF